MSSGHSGIIRFRNRKEAEKALSEIVEDGGKRPEFRIEENPDGTCVISILERDGGPVAGTIGA